MYMAKGIMFSQVKTCDTRMYLGHLDTGLTLIGFTSDMQDVFSESFVNIGFSATLFHV